MCGKDGTQKWTYGYDYEEYDVGQITAGEWHKIVIHARWRSDETGFFKVWLNGTREVAAFDKITTYLDASKLVLFEPKISPFRFFPAGQKLTPNVQKEGQVPVQCWLILQLVA